jgi:hypothetical protein
VDLDKAPRNAQGEVEFSADLYLFKPKDMNKGNNAVLFEVSNRGGRGILRLVNGGNSSDANAEIGDGFLLREGYTIAWLGWQFDVADQGQNLRLYAPVAHDAGGKEIRGLVRSDFTPSLKIDDMPLGHIMLGPGGGKSYPVDDPGNAKNVLTVRDAPDGSRQTIPRSQWRFAHSVEGNVVSDPHFIHLDGGFQPGRIYEVVYEAKDPVVVGTGLAAVRDFLSYLKNDPQSTAPVRRVYAVGISQSAVSTIDLRSPRGTRSRCRVYSSRRMCSRTPTSRKPTRRRVRRQAFWTLRASRIQRRRYSSPTLPMNTGAVRLR